MHVLHLYRFIRLHHFDNSYINMSDYIPEDSTSKDVASNGNVV